MQNLKKKREKIQMSLSLKGKRPTDKEQIYASHKGKTLMKVS